MLISARQRDAISFLFYFLRLRLNVMLGQYYTANPIDIKWRWHHWQQIKILQSKPQRFFHAG